MLKVVVDVNIWVSTLIKPQGRYAQLLEEITQKGELITSEEILAQAREVALRPRIRNKYALNESQVDEALKAAHVMATVVSDVPDVNVVEDDPDDDVIVACAVASEADYIVSYDPHLTNLKVYHGVRILYPKEFIRVLQ